MEKKMATYSSLLSQFNLRQDEPLKAHTSFKIGGPADLFAQPESISELTGLFKAANQLNVPVTLIGGGTNLLISDNGIRGLVITTRKLKNKITFFKKETNQSTIQAAAGVRLSHVCRFATDHSLSGLEFAAGIPGTLGGAVMGNAGTPDGDMARIVKQVVLLNPETLKTKTYTTSPDDFSYRKSRLNGIVLDIFLSLVPSDKNKIKKKVTAILNQRRLAQPMNAASAGCFFKNPDQGKPAGQLIEEAGLKGFRINDAQVSDHHANYIVNLNHARCKDILNLKEMVQSTVFKKFNINLETEVRIEGE
jgi:UDP-N-acetylmuramate dehydrogenase